MHSHRHTSESCQQQAEVSIHEGKLAHTVHPCISTLFQISNTLCTATLAVIPGPTSMPQAAITCKCRTQVWLARHSTQRHISLTSYIFMIYNSRCRSGHHNALPVHMEVVRHVTEVLKDEVQHLMWIIDGLHQGVLPQTTRHPALPFMVCSWIML